MGPLGRRFTKVNEIIQCTCTCTLLLFQPSNSFNSSRGSAYQMLVPTGIEMYMHYDVVWDGPEF